MIRENVIKIEDSIPIVITTDKTLNSIVEAYHAYKKLLKPFINN